jgi:uncharacterized protein YacL
MVATGVVLATICAASGYFIGSQIPQLQKLWWAGWAGAAAGLGAALLTLGIEQVIKRIPLKTILGSTLGLFIGLGIAKLVSYPFDQFLELPNLQIPLYIILSTIFGYIGMVLGGKKISDVNAPSFLETSKPGRLPQLLLDTSVIIDGRIADIITTGFIRTPVWVPRFVLNELQYVADSSDALRRNRGRRGLEMLNRMQKESPVPVRIVDMDVEGVRQVDAKLVQLARELNCPIITNDYNLHRVAGLQGVVVLNINELSNAVKSVVLPGETLTIRVIQEGKEAGQGVGYLDDGTMVVIENAKRFIGKEVEVLVTSVLQTTTGRMIFSEIKNGGTLRKP